MATVRHTYLEIQGSATDASDSDSDDDDGDEVNTEPNDDDDEGSNHQWYGNIKDGLVGQIHRIFPGMKTIHYIT